MINFNYKEILTDNNLSVKEKLKKIEENFNNIKSENKSAYIKAKSTLLSEYKECPFCKDYYKKEFFNTSIRFDGRCKCPTCGYEVSAARIKAEEWSGCPKCIRPLQIRTSKKMKKAGLA